MQPSVAFDPDAECPRWLLFLKEIFDGDEEVIAFVHRAVGYSLTGDCREEVFFLSYGKGANGKGKFAGVLAEMMGDYWWEAPFSTFEQQRGGGAANDLAALAGKRFVTSSEARQGARFNEGRIKSITGRDAITARFLYREFFTFQPQFKLWLGVNTLPKAYDPTDGVWRRVIPILFPRRFLGSKANRNLPEKLRAELPGILAWAVRGCLEWQREGLKPPEDIRDGITDYRTDNDPIGEFLAEQLESTTKGRMGAGDAFRLYQDWCEGQDIPPRDRMSLTAFGTAMAARFERKTIHGKRYYFGISEPEAEELVI